MIRQNSSRGGGTRCRVDLRQHTADLLDHLGGPIVPHEVQSGRPVGGFVLRDLARGAGRVGAQVVVRGVHADGCFHQHLSATGNDSGRYSPLPPWKVWTWSEMVPTSMMGSRRAAPVRERHGIRQKAETVLAPASTAAAVDVYLIVIDGVVAKGKLD
nr:hypothetical protein CFP56_30184 [Quercus suber]